MTAEGLKAVKQLSAKGIRTNVTLIFSPAQALLAARAGASYVSPFIGRLNDISSNGNSLIESIAAIFDMHGIETEIIAASIRSPEDVVDAALAGAASSGLSLLMRQSGRIFLYNTLKHLKSGNAVRM